MLKYNQLVLALPVAMQLKPQGAKQMQLDGRITVKCNRFELARWDVPMSRGGWLGSVAKEFVVAREATVDSWELLAEGAGVESYGIIRRW